MMPSLSTSARSSDLSRNVLLSRNSCHDCFGFTLRHVVLYPPAQPGCSDEHDSDSDSGNSSGGSDTLQLVEACSVQPGSAAARAGLANADRIIALNDQPTQHLPYEHIVCIIKTSLHLSLLVVSGSSSSSGDQLCTYNSSGQLRMQVMAAEPKCGADNDTLMPLKSSLHNRHSYAAAASRYGYGSLHSPVLSADSGYPSIDVLTASTSSAAESDRSAGGGHDEALRIRSLLHEMNTRRNLAHSTFRMPPSTSVPESSSSRLDVPRSAELMSNGLKPTRGLIRSAHSFDSVNARQQHLQQAASSSHSHYEPMHILPRPAAQPANGARSPLCVQTEGISRSSSLSVVSSTIPIRPAAPPSYQSYVQRRQKQQQLRQQHGTQPAAIQHSPQLRQPHPLHNPHQPRQRSPQPIQHWRQHSPQPIQQLRQYSPQPRQQLTQHSPQPIQHSHISIHCANESVSSSSSSWQPRSSPRQTRTSPARMDEASSSNSCHILISPGSSSLAHSQPATVSPLYQHRDVSRLTRPLQVSGVARVPSTEPPAPLVQYRNSPRRYTGPSASRCAPHQRSPNTHAKRFACGEWNLDLQQLPSIEHQRSRSFIKALDQDDSTSSETEESSSCVPVPTFAQVPPQVMHFKATAAKCNGAPPHTQVDASALTACLDDLQQQQTSTAVKRVRIAGHNEDEGGQEERQSAAKSGGYFGQRPALYRVDQFGERIPSAGSVSDDAVAASESLKFDTQLSCGGAPAESTTTAAAAAAGTSEGGGTATGRQSSVIGTKIANRRNKTKRPSSAVMTSADVLNANQQQPARPSRNSDARRDGAPKRRSGSHAGIHRFIKLFQSSANNSPEKSVSEPVGSNGTAGCVRVSNCVRQGWLQHRQVSLGSAGKQTEGRLEECYGVLTADKLLLCRKPPQDGLVSGADVLASLDVHACIVDIHYSDINRNPQHVLRLTTQQHTEHLIQASSADDMLRWIEHLQASSKLVASAGGDWPELSSSDASHNSSASNTRHINVTNVLNSLSDQANNNNNNNNNSSSSNITNSLPPVVVSTNGNNVNNNNNNNSSSKASGNKTDEPSMALIMKRYEAKQQSPSTKRKTQQASKSHTSTTDITPKSGRKWKMVRKNNSCPSAQPGTSSQTQPPANAASSSGAALGLKLHECATGEDDQVPLLIQLCSKVVEAHGMDSVGVYRVPGNTAAVNALSTQLETGFENVDFTDPRWKDVNVVSSLMKSFFRKLPEPLLTDKLYPIFIDANRITGHDKRLTKIRYLVRKLPKQNLDTLKYLMTHLHKVYKNSHINKMEARNLALMFGPSIVRASDDSMQTMVNHMSDQCKLIETMLIYCDWIFYSNMEDVTPPSQSTTGISDDSMIQSFSDMSDLLNRVQPPEEIWSRDQEKRGLFAPRRNSKRNGAGNAPVQDLRNKPPSATNRSSSNRPVISDPKATESSRRTQSDKPIVVQDSVNGPYQERNIDEEIAVRAAAVAEVDAEAEAEAEEDDEEPQASASSPAAETVGSGKAVSDTSIDLSGTRNRCELEAVYAEMRRKREENIYNARRVFIAGPAFGSGRGQLAGRMIGVGVEQPGASGQSSPMAGGSESAGSDTNIDQLVQHTRHLNVTGIGDLDVLSPETREKIRRLQQDGQLKPPYMTKSHTGRLLGEHRLKEPLLTADSDVEMISSTLSDLSTGSQPQHSPGQASHSSAPPPSHHGQRAIDRTWYETPAESSEPSEPSDATLEPTTEPTPVAEEPTAAASVVPYAVTEPSVSVTVTSDETAAAEPEDEQQPPEQQQTTPLLAATQQQAPASSSSTNSLQSTTSSGMFQRTLNATEKTRARISQKIRFRANNNGGGGGTGSGVGGGEREKRDHSVDSVGSSSGRTGVASRLVNRIRRNRDDPRRHTLSDIEQVKQALEQHEQQQQQHEHMDSARSTHSAAPASQHGYAKVAKPSSSSGSRFKSWFKFSVLGKSSPDLTCDDPAAAAPSGSGSAGKPKSGSSQVTAVSAVV